MENDKFHDLAVASENIIETIKLQKISQEHKAQAAVAAAIMFASENELLHEAENYWEHCIESIKENKR